MADIQVAPHLTCGLVAHSQVIADKAYDCDAFAQGLAARQVSVVIPPRAGRLKPRLFDKTAYRMRHAVERLFVHLKQARRVATRYDKTVASYGAFILVVHMLLLLRRASAGPT